MNYYDNLIKENEEVIKKIRIKKDEVNNKYINHINKYEQLNKEKEEIQSIIKSLKLISFVYNSNLNKTSLKTNLLALFLLPLLLIPCFSVLSSSLLIPYIATIPRIVLLIISSSIAITTEGLLLKSYLKESEKNNRLLKNNKKKFNILIRKLKFENVDIEDINLFDKLDDYYNNIYYPNWFKKIKENEKILYKKHLIIKAIDNKIKMINSNINKLQLEKNDVEHIILEEYKLNNKYDDKLNKSYIKRRI